MKTKEELIALKEEVETVNKKLAALTEEELVQVTGGSGPQLVKPSQTLSLTHTVSGLTVETTDGEVYYCAGVHQDQRGKRPW